MYLTVAPSKNDGNTIYKLTAKDVPVDGFWSVSMYNVKGHFEKNQYERARQRRREIRLRLHGN
jgi:hypothetical protein